MLIVSLSTFQVFWCCKYAEHFKFLDAVNMQNISCVLEQNISSFLGCCKNANILKYKSALMAKLVNVLLFSLVVYPKNKGLLLKVR